jgi:hypothetical protein
MIGDFFTTHNFNILQFLLVAIGYLMPIPLSIIALHLWHHYRQERFIAGIKWALLEVHVPRDVIKSPAAMELIFSNAFYQKTTKGFWEQYIQGAPWFWFSLELVSIDGKVHFFIRTPTRMKDLVETQIYAQYPQAKVVEVDDYAFHISQYKKNGEWYMWGCEYSKLKEDFLPIRTYRDMEEMDSGTKEEYKIDPITPVIELLGSLPTGQQLWIQIIIRQNIKKYHSHATGKHVDFYVAAQEFMFEMLKPFTRVQKNDAGTEATGMDVRTPKPIESLVKVVSENAGLLHFDCGIRVVTLANKALCTEAEFNILRRNSRLIWRQYAQPYVNELNRINSTQFDAPWSDPTGLALSKYKKRTLDFYRTRTFFHPPLQYSFKYPKLLHAFFPSGSPQIFVMSSRELATIFHFPGMVSETPSFKRLESKIAKPPSNLPL